MTIIKTILKRVFFTDNLAILSGLTILTFTINHSALPLKVTNAFPSFDYMLYIYHLI